MPLHVVTSFKDADTPYAFYTRQKPLDVNVEFKAVGVAVSMKRTFWVLTPCSSERVKRFGGEFRVED
jgi:hypothetical protein